MKVYVLIGGVAWEGDVGSTLRVFATRKDADNAREDFIAKFNYDFADVMEVEVEGEAEVEVEENGWDKGWGE